MERNKWLTEKPEFNEECALTTTHSYKEYEAKNKM